MHLQHASIIITACAVLSSSFTSCYAVAASSGTGPAVSQVNSRLDVPYPGYTIHLGSTGFAVKEVQLRLNDTGFHCGLADGVYGPLTLHAVESFQKSRQLAVDGTVGPLTWASLFSSKTSFSLDSAIRTYLSRRAGLVSIAVLNLENGLLYTYNPGVEFDTASIVKVSIMATLLHQAELTKKSLTAQERSLMVPMIEYSDNSAATALWNMAGGAKGVRAFTSLVGMTGTYPNTAGYWGLTHTTATDQVKLIRDFVLPNSLLNSIDRAYGLNLMAHVTRSQRWGVSGGVPSGVTVDLKNGWLPLGTDNWEINSIGYVHGGGRNYVIAVLSRNNPTERYGIDTVQGISTLVWNANARATTN